MGNRQKKLEMDTSAAEVDGVSDPNTRDYITQLTQAEVSELRGSINSLLSLDVDVHLSDLSSLQIKLKPAVNHLMEVVDGMSNLPQIDGTVEITFVHNLSKYLTKSRLLLSEKGNFYVDLSGDIFLVQRRKNFRVEVPVHVVPVVSFKPIQRPERQYKGKLVNISLGGCLLAIEASGQIFRDGELIELNLTIEGGKVIPLKASIRRITMEPKASRPSIHLGIEFDKLNSFEESRINEVVMKCYRATNRFGNRLKSQ